MYRSVQSKIRTTYTWRVYEFTLKIQLCRAENTTQLYSDSRSYNLDAGRKSEGKNWNIIFRIQDSENTYPKIMLTSWCQQLNKLQSYHNNMCNFIKSSNNVAYYPNTHTHTHILGPLVQLGWFRAGFLLWDLFMVDEVVFKNVVPWAIFGLSLMMIIPPLLHSSQQAAHTKYFVFNLGTSSPIDTLLVIG